MGLCLESTMAQYRAIMQGKPRSKYRLRSSIDKNKVQRQEKREIPGIISNNRHQDRLYHSTAEVMDSGPESDRLQVLY